MQVIRRLPYQKEDGNKMCESAYQTLLDFVTTKMRMAHVYQPVMLMTLRENNGKASVESISRSILAHDQSQLEYYEQITNNMVGRVLRNHGIVTQEPRQSFYTLTGYDEMPGDPSHS